MNEGARFEEFHARQRELGACRCAECRGDARESVAAADLRAPEADVADGAPGEHEAAAAAPFDPEGVRRTFVSEPFSLPSWQGWLDRAKSGGTYGPSAPSEADEIRWFRQFGPTHAWRP
jgi:hypothetical protein